MATTLHADLIDGGRARKTDRGWEFTRVWTVAGVSGDAVQQLTAAVDAGGLPPIGTAHPAYPAAKLASLDPQALGNGVVRVTGTYTEPVAGTPNQPPGGESVLEVGATLQDVQVDTDIDGKLMTVEYTDPDGTTHTQTGTVTIGMPRPTVVRRRVENHNPSVEARAFVGKVNSGSVPGVAPELDEPDHWRCNQVVGTSSDGGKTWLVVREIEYSLSGWDAEVAYIDPETGRKPADIVKGTGIRTFQVVPRADFMNGLNL